MGSSAGSCLPGFVNVGQKKRTDGAPLGPRFWTDGVYMSPQFVVDAKESVREKLQV